MGGEEGRFECFVLFWFVFEGDGFIAIQVQGDALRISKECSYQQGAWVA